MFGNKSNRLIYALYSILAALTVLGLVIIVLICTEHTVLEIIILEIVWEILVDLMCLYLLYLFISKLYALLQLSVQSHTNSHSKSDILKQIIEATKQSINHSRTENSKSDSKRKPKFSQKKSKSQRENEPKSMNTMTIDGLKYDPVCVKATGRHGSPAPSPAGSPEPSMHTENPMEHTMMSRLALSDGEQTDNEQETIQYKYVAPAQGESSAIDLIGVMTKITLLVCIAVLVSVLGVVGNVFIEMEELRHIEKHEIALEELWADILPVIDIVFTSLMLYLQFSFTHSMYRKIFGRLDVWFLENCLKWITYVWSQDAKREIRCNTEAVVCQTHSAKTLETIPEPSAHK